jgi:nucleotide-binding universal stress UspA family protein
MRRPIVFHVDLSEQSRRLVPYATQVAHREGAKLIFVHVNREIVDEGAVLTGVQSGPMEELRSYRPTNPDVEFDHQILNGLTGDAIVSFASEVQARMILLASPPGRGFWNRLVGRAHEFITMRAPCPVMLLRPEMFEAKTAAPAFAGNMELSVA